MVGNWSMIYFFNQFIDTIQISITNMQSLINNKTIYSLDKDNKINCYQGEITAIMSHITIICIKIII